MIVCNNLIEAKCLDDSLRTCVKNDLTYQKRGQKRNKKPSQALEITADVAGSVASRNLKNVISTWPDGINCYRKASGLYVGKSF